MIDFIFSLFSYMCFSEYENLAEMLKINKLVHTALNLIPTQTLTQVTWTKTFGIKINSL